MHGGIDIPGVELLDELGRGAHGAVYRARRGAEYYAVKVALAASDPSAFVRFQREAIALARAKHPGLPRVLDVAKSGAPYLVMELVEGETLAARLCRGTLSEEETRSLGLQLADVLAHIHRLGLVHRDVKPRNIIFDEKSGRARIVDFGIAIGTASTNYAAAEGTVPYAAPEQLRGLSIDGRADLYSLGCVLYECLCGMPPLGPLSLSRLGKADPTSDEAKLERSGASPELVRVIVRLVSHETKSRFADASAVMGGLRSGSAELGSEPRAAAFLRSGSGALIGRERELAALRKAWSEVSGGSQRALAIEGWMGSGKTALLQTFCDQVRTEGYAGIYVSCAFYEPAPFGVARRIFDAFLAQIGEQRFRDAAAGFEALLPAISPSLRRVFPDAPAVPDSDDAHHVVLESAFKCLQRLLELDEATALCVDDTQWIDAGSAAILRKLLGAGLTRTLIVVARRVEKEPSPEVESLLGSGAERLPALALGTLDEGSLSAVIANYLGSDAVPGEVVARVAALSAPTPLGILEAVRTLLEERAILPDWQGWRLQAQVAEGVSLPNSVIEMLRARITGLEPLVPEILVAAAVVGMDFELAVLPEITGRTYDEVSHALREACRAALVTGGALSYRFVHQAVRDALLAACTESKLRDLNGRAAEALDRKFLDESDAKDPELIYRVADLYWRGEWRYTPERAIEVIESAARSAFEAYDNRQALLLIERAAEIRHVIGGAPGEQTLYVHGEVLIRLGNLAAGRELLGRALALSSDPLHRAEVLSRVAWSHEGQLDSTQAWAALRRAFAELGVEPPSASAGSFARSGGAWLRHALGRVPPLTGDDKSQRRQKILCALYYRAFRVGMLGTNLPLTVQAALLGLEAAQSLGVSAALSKAYLAYGFLLTAMGQNAKGRYYLSRGEDVARVTGNPVAIAHAIQLHTTIACWDGRISEALEAGARCLLEHGHWQDFSEHCQLAYNQQLLECVRGRSFEELVWVEHVLRQVELNAEASNVLEFIELGARALLVHLGRSAEADQLLRRLREVTVKIPKTSAYYVLSFGPRVRALTDAADFGPALDRLDAEFRQGNHDPARVHLAVGEYYVHLAHARIHACLRSLDRDRARMVKDLERAAKDLRAAARIPMLRAHSLVVDAYLALFTGDDERSSKLFAEADALAIEEESPWVRYAVARGRAHRCRARKNLEVARGEARRAEQIAQENGSVHRLRWIREEFGLSQTSSAIPLPSQSPSTDVRRLNSTTSSSSSDARELRRWRARSRLAAMEESATGQEQGGDALLVELLVGLGAREVHLFSFHPPGGVHWVTGVRTGGQASGPSEADSFVCGVVAQKAAALVDDTEVFRSRLAVPIIERGDVELIVYAEAPGCGNFDREDCELVSQLTTAFFGSMQPEEIGGDRRGGRRAFRIGRSATDFALALAQQVDHLAADDERGSVVGRLATLSRLLQETTRLQTHSPALVNLNDVAARACRRLRVVVGDRLEILSALESTVNPVYLDPEHIELALLHCAMGANQRTRGRGALVLEVSNIMVDEAFAGDFRGLKRGVHTMLTVAAIGDPLDQGGAPGASDRDSPNGFGELAEQVCRDVALANDGVLALQAGPFGGANLQMLFRCAATSLDVERRPIPAGTETILVVDRDERLRQSIAEQARRAGYRVLLAEDLEGGRLVFEIHGGKIDLTVLETALEVGVGFPSLPRAPTELVVYTSRYPWNALRAAGVALPRARYLQKPYSIGTLLGSARALLNESRARSSGTAS